MTKRLQDWPNRLAEAHGAANGMEFAWGRLDCCLYAADLVAAMTGRDPAGDLRGAYEDVKGARRILKRYGGSIETLAEWMAATHAWPEVAVTFAQRGDLALVTLPLSPDMPPDWPDALGIFLGSRIAVMGQSGPIHLQTTCALRAWRV